MIRSVDFANVCRCRRYSSSDRGLSRWDVSSQLSHVTDQIWLSSAVIWRTPSFESMTEVTSANNRFRYEHSCSRWHLGFPTRTWPTYIFDFIYRQANRWTHRSGVWVVFPISVSMMADGWYEHAHYWSSRKFEATIGLKTVLLWQAYSVLVLSTINSQC
jgi:hypothetical protein